MKPLFYLFTFLALFLTDSCEEDTKKDKEETAGTMEEALMSSADIPVNPNKEVYFGNLHVHTSWSFDGYTNGSVTGPDDAYRWAKGAAIPGGGGGGDIQIKVPLDWYAVSDHAEYMGVFPMMDDPNNPISKLEIATKATSDDQVVAFGAYKEILAEISSGQEDPELASPEIKKNVWKEMIETADKHYEPGKFTTFPAFEWTSNPNSQNLHRVVLFQNSKTLPEIAYSAMDSDKPEDLWDWMELQRNNGSTLFAVPHNGNASNGLMFPVETSYGGSNVKTLEYAQTRMRNEPLYEISQIKGTSETHPTLSPNDEFGDFELWDYTLAATALPPEHKKGGYMRDAYKRGIQQEAAGLGNPFKYGLIGDSDTHNSASPIEEDNYSGKFGMENNPEHRLMGPPGFDPKNQKQIREFSTAGVAGVWAESNTREAIYKALLSKETFATSGVRLKVRVFGGYDFTNTVFDNKDWITNAYKNGVPMGSDLSKSTGKAPSFIIQAIKETDGANLDRIQIIKGWVDDKGETYEKIYNVALSDDRTVDSNGKVAPVGNTVDAKNASYTNDIGAAELKTVWTDPDFDAEQHAFYYARVIQIPTPRWSTYDAKTLGVEPRDDLPVSIQERAWSSPIWYNPN